MDDKLNNSNQTIFEQIKEYDKNGNEYWGGRKLAKVLEYSDFRNLYLLRRIFFCYI
ncbi:MAG: hypothetical protein JEZ09_11230 [Salinivirgaceae bacterium]|nr:hypothetical protein [Salinivirgaceae bacterium]